MMMMVVVIHDVYNNLETSHSVFTSLSVSTNLLNWDRRHKMT